MSQPEQQHENQETPVASAAAPTPPIDAAALATTITTINRKWSLKQAVYALVALFMTGFFLVDGMVRYPARGAEAAEYLEFQYLQVYDKERGGIATLTGIDDPASRLSQLEEKVRASGKLDASEQAQRDWLDNLKLINRLSPDATAIPRKNYKDASQVESAQKRLEALTKAWTLSDGNTRKSPVPLSAFDIPSQWVGMAISAILSIWVVVVFLRVRSRTYRWDPATMSLTLPRGTITPSDIAEVDKRKWDKFYVTLRIKPEHATLGGKAIEFDLLRYEPLEAWILAMEQKAFPSGEHAAT
jgi:hypothetical protein